MTCIDTLPVYPPAVCAPAGDTVPPTQTHKFAPPEGTVVGTALGVKVVAPAALLAVLFQPPVQLPIGIVAAAGPVRIAGNVNVRATEVAAALVTVNTPAPASVMAMVLFTPGVTLPNAKSVPVTVMAESTVAVAWMVAFWACRDAAPKLKLAARAADSTVAVRIASLPDRGSGLIPLRGFRGVPAPRRSPGRAMRVPAITLSENSTVYGELFRSHPIEVQVGTL